MNSYAHRKRVLRTAGSAAQRTLASLALGLLALALGGCVTHYYPAPPEVVYERSADSAGTVYHVPSEPTWVESNVTYVVSSRYYPWWSLDYFYLSYGSGCCGLSVGLGWGYPPYASWYRPWYRPWYAWYDPWYWPPYYPGWYAPHYPRHGHHRPHHGYAHDAYWRHKWDEQAPVPRREVVDGRYRLPGDQAVAQHPSDRRDRIGTRPPRDPEDRKPGPWIEPGPAAVISSVTPALQNGGEGSATTVRNRGGSKDSGYRELHPWEQSDPDGPAVRRVIPADGGAAATPAVRVISRTPSGGPASTVRSRSGAKVSPVRVQPVETPRAGLPSVRAVPAPSVSVPTQRTKVAPSRTVPRQQAPVSVMKPRAAPTARAKPSAAPKRSTPVYRVPSRASAPRPSAARSAPARRASVRGPARDADGR